MNFNIFDRKIGDNYPCLIIAELSANHKQNFDVAVETIKAAKKAGADAVKLQTYTADTITINSNKPDFLIPSTSPWASYKKLHNLYDEAHTPWEWHDELFKLGKEIGIYVFSSPFDQSAVDFLEDLNCPIYKIASPEITDIPLLKYIAQKSKPVIISTGIAEYQDINLAIDTLKYNGCNEFAILKCTSEYPTPFNMVNLKAMLNYKNDFDCIYGLSDHTIGDEVCVAAVALGARIIEKHFVVDKTEESLDSFFSLDFHEFKSMVTKVRNIEIAMGSSSYSVPEKLKIKLSTRRSLYACKKINKGELITTDNVKSVRPGHGLHPKYLEQILGKKVNKNLKIGDRLSLDCFDI